MLFLNQQKTCPACVNAPFAGESDAALFVVLTLRSDIFPA